MKRPLFLFLFGFVLMIAFFGCLSGPGVEPPRAAIEDGKDQAGASGSMDDQRPVISGTGGAGAQTAVGTGGMTAATGGAGGSEDVGTMDASVADGGVSMDSGAVEGGPPGSDAALDDDAGSEQ